MNQALIVSETELTNGLFGERFEIAIEEYFQMLLNLRNEGFYEPNPTRSQMNWLRKSYPIGKTDFD